MFCLPLSSRNGQPKVTQHPRQGQISLAHSAVEMCPCSCACPTSTLCPSLTVSTLHSSQQPPSSSFSSITSNLVVGKALGVGLPIPACWLKRERRLASWLGCPIWKNSNESWIHEGKAHACLWEVWLMLNIFLAVSMGRQSSKCYPCNIIGQFKKTQKIKHL